MNAMFLRASLKALCFSFSMQKPSTKIVPVCDSRLLIQRSKVDFPAPDCPITTTNSPLFTEREILSRAIKLLLYFFVRLEISSIIAHF